MNIEALRVRVASYIHRLYILVAGVTDQGFEYAIHKGSGMAEAVRFVEKNKNGRYVSVTPFQSVPDLDEATETMVEVPLT